MSKINISKVDISKVDNIKKHYFPTHLRAVRAFCPNRISFLMQTSTFLFRAAANQASWMICKVITIIPPKQFDSHEFFLYLSEQIYRIHEF